MKRTVFVVGAGASCDFDLPSGSALIDSIRSLLNAQFPRSGSNPGRRSSGRGPIVDALAQGDLEEIEAYCATADHVHAGLLGAISIDRFLDSRRGDARVNRLGKLSIAQAIFEAERTSKLYRLSNLEKHETLEGLAELRSTWLGELYKQLSQLRHHSELVDGFFEKTSFVVFNYDRCIEHFFFHALFRSADLSADDAIKIVEKMPIVHVYGSLGSLDYRSARSNLGFGAAHPNLSAAAEKIQTFTETIASATRDRISSFITDAERIVFLGFGFDRQNLRLLFPEPERHTRDFWGTGFYDKGFDEHRNTALERLYRTSTVRSDGYVERFPNMKCTEFLRAFGPRLF